MSTTATSDLDGKAPTLSVSDQVIVKPDELFALHRPGRVLVHSAITVLTNLVTVIGITQQFVLRRPQIISWGVERRTASRNPRFHCLRKGALKHPHRTFRSPVPVAMSGRGSGSTVGVVHTAE